MAPKRILVIAGSDSSGGAGLEADQKVIAAHGCYAMTVTTALTAQNTTGVYDIHHVPAEFLRKQIDAVMDDIGVDVVKTALDMLRTRLVPRATILTPNIPEAVCLLRTDDPANNSNIGAAPIGSVETADDLETMARAVRRLGPKWVLVKGGHCPFRRDGTRARTDAEKEVVVDVLVGGERPEEEVVVRVETGYCRSRHTHGTGCSLASAIASNLAKGMDMPAAVRTACRYVEAGIRTAPGLGRGNGPLNHFHSVYTLPFSPGYFVDYLLERPDVAPVWHKFVNHPFVLAMGDATLPLESFKGYLIQDYLYLIQFSRSNALGAYKAKTMKDIAASAEIVTHIFKEMELHIGYCKGFGISREEMEATEEKEDWMALQMAMAPCILGYGVIGKQLHADSRSKREGNLYWSWIQNYVAEDYQAAVETESELLERHAVLQSPARIEELVKIFIHATKMEIAFWEMFKSS
ncbi:hypothetical protein BT67DRAFT_437510 [Trichocladium antarcticum]|uniref:Phosphomethylpyrimidine kinase n=1 Tax=Trichocladium antarcticum TaxID=1450529 RepID=A0AAN6ZHW7_9PEZI|nr:hypothetical protein BT67DRAFT_437510 [Trichocladium antarcticum]